MKILVTGGTGYIGSNTVVLLLNAGYEVVIVDNLYNSQASVVDKIKNVTGKDVAFYELDILDREGMNRVFDEHKIDAVIHFAGLKAVGESVSKPLFYYHNNIEGTLALCEVMAAHGCKSIVFSSSATVYGVPKTVPIKEDFPLSTTNPYGSTKLMIEQILQDLYVSDNEWNVTILRYFNPIGADETGTFGENPNGIPNNLMPYIVKVANKELPHLNVFGDDYPTRDGTGVRDYIHVVDLANGHLKALDKLDGVNIYNLGTGNGYSVLELVKAFEEHNGVPVPYKVAPRRPGDIAECFADPSKAYNELGWKAERDVVCMVKSAWNFCKKNFQ